MHGDLGRARRHAGVDALADAGRRDLEVRDAHDPVREPGAQLLGDLVEPRVRARDAAAVVDEQDRARHPARAACSSACARSARRSSACSIPTERRTTASFTPLRRFSSAGKAAWLMVHG